VKHQPDNPMRCRSVSLSCKGKINHLIRLPGKSTVRVTLEEGKTFSEERARQAVDEAGFTLRSYSEAEGETGGSDAK